MAHPVNDYSALNKILSHWVFLAIFTYPFRMERSGAVVMSP